MKRLSVLLFFLVLGAGAARALSPGDGVVVLYKDRSKVPGVLVSQTRAQVTIDMGGARMTSNLSDVQSVVAKKTAVGRFEELLKAAGDDPEKLRAAAAFARAHNLHTYYETLAKRLGLPPGAVAATAVSAASVGDSPPLDGRAPAPATAPAAVRPPPVDSAVQGAPAPTLGFPSSNALEIVSADDIYAGPLPRRERDRDDGADFLKKQADAREARTHEVTNPTSDMQFKLQQALDRSARGLPFSAP
jgi:hypothetical protein